MTLTGVTIADPGLSLTCQPSQDLGGADLAPGDKLTCTGTRTLTQADIDNGSVENTGTVAGTDPDGGEVSDRADEDVPLAQAPHLTLTKAGRAGRRGRWPARTRATSITYTLTATNDGNVTLTGVSISDPSLPRWTAISPWTSPPARR